MLLAPSMYDGTRRSALHRVNQQRVISLKQKQYQKMKLLYFNEMILTPDIKPRTMSQFYVGFVTELTQKRHQRSSSSCHSSSASSPAKRSGLRLRALLRCSLSYQ